MTQEAEKGKTTAELVESMLDYWDNHTGPGDAVDYLAGMVDRHFQSKRNGGNHVDRMVEEHRELLERTIKLRDFICNSDTFLKLEMADGALLHAQLGVMESYAVLLATRLRRAGVPV